MSDERVRYELRDKVAVVHFDDGKANVISPAATAELHAALDRAEKEAAALVLVGRAGRFSAGFDLSVMSAGGSAVREMVVGGAALGTRLFEFPIPTVAAVTGHALAMGAVLLLSIDERFAADGNFKIGLNESAIGMILPDFALILSRERLAKTHLIRATANAEIYAPAEALEAGFVDHVVPAEQVVDAAVARAAELAELDTSAARGTKRALRSDVAVALRDSVDQGMPSN
jgi:enoyl-CoA hydratase